MTQTGHAKKLADIKSLQQKLDRSKEDMNIAKEQGDLSENFGYTEARKDVENLSRALEEKTLEIAGAQVTDPMEWMHIDMEGVPRAMLGALVTIQRGGKEETILLGGAGDDIPGVVPYNSPLGKALIPKLEGATIRLEISEQTEEIKILTCTTPTEKKLREIYETPEKEIKPAAKKKAPAPDPSPSLSMD